MKKLIIFVLFLAVILVGANKLTFSYCDQPIHYRVDTVDPKFNLSKDAFSADINQAAQIWDAVMSKDLFLYDPKGDLSINLIYDERQSLTSQINQLENTIQSDKQTLNPQFSEYQKLAADFQQKRDSLNNAIAEWNSKGGAPPDEYKKLIQQQQDLQAQVNNLNAMAGSLKLSANSYNVKVNQLNQTIGTFNSALEQRPEEGIFKSPENRIEIYFDINKPELVHTLAHELGHALGIGHVSDPNAIMYPQTSQKLIPTNEEILALKDVCKRHTYFEIFETRFLQIIAYYQKVLKLSSN